MQQSVCHFPPAAPLQYTNYYEREGAEDRNGSAGFVGGVMKRSDDDYKVISSNNVSDSSSSTVLLCRFSNLLQGNGPSGTKLGISSSGEVQPAGTVYKLNSNINNFTNFNSNSQFAEYNERTGVISLD